MATEDFIFISGDNWYVSMWIHLTKIHYGHSMPSTVLCLRQRGNDAAQEWELAFILNVGLL